GLVREVESGLEVVDFGVLRTPADMPLQERLLQLYRDLKEVLLLHQPQSGAVEKLFFRKNFTNAIAVGQGRGVAMLALAEFGLPVAEYTPMEVKQAVVGWGGADKPQVQEMVRALLQLDSIPRPDDAADALAIAICHLHSYRLSSLMHDHQ
ncbi:MAG TPA: crossover junction endodeoxyribonuclease RuvC, partial [Anaerolineaceae bacterium]|nr:crossover junction endodeoxyribonuclease RuvC [Anaerolineaceae bacterium]